MAGIERLVAQTGATGIAVTVDRVDLAVVPLGEWIARDARAGRPPRWTFGGRLGAGRRLRRACGNSAGAMIGRPTRVVLVDDEGLYRRTVRELLDAAPDLVVV